LSNALEKQYATDTSANKPSQPAHENDTHQLGQAKIAILTFLFRLFFYTSDPTVHKRAEPEMTANFCQRSMPKPLDFSRKANSSPIAPEGPLKRAT
jgi:hypothetical protein